MLNIMKIVYLINALCVCGIWCCDSSGKIMYMATEQPRVTYYNPKYIRYANLTSARYGRHDPTYYVGLHFDLLIYGGNNVTINFYFYQLLTNVYKRSFVEMHFGVCDLLQKDNFFGTALRQGKILEGKCPIGPGLYHFYNMTVPVAIIPKSFPFTNGRIYMNATVVATGELIASGHINMELKYRKCGKPLPKQNPKRS